jgi:hypothetical protein
VSAVWRRLACVLRVLLSVRFLRARVGVLSRLSRVLPFAQKMSRAGSCVCGPKKQALCEPPSPAAPDALLSPPPWPPRRRASREGGGGRLRASRSLVVLAVCCAAACGGERPSRWNCAGGAVRVCVRTCDGRGTNVTAPHAWAVQERPAMGPAALPPALLEAGGAGGPRGASMAAAARL